MPLAKSSTPHYFAHPAVSVRQGSCHLGTLDSIENKELMEEADGEVRKEIQGLGRFFGTKSTTESVAFLSGLA